MDRNIRIPVFLVLSVLFIGGLLLSAAAERVESASVIEKHFRNLNLLTIERELRMERIVPFLADRRENIQLDFSNCYLAYSVEADVDIMATDAADGFDGLLEDSRAFIAPDGRYLAADGGSRVSSFLPDIAQLYFDNGTTDTPVEVENSVAVDNMSLLSELTDTRMEMVAPLTPDALPSVSGGSMERYIVKKGENLATIARKLKVPYKDLKRVNTAKTPFVDGGRVIRIPGMNKPGTVASASREPVQSKASRATRNGFVWPVRAKRISSRFGYRIHPISRRRKFHNGIDLAATYGRQIVAAATGIVEYAGWKSYYGKTVIIRHANGLKTLYAHCSRISVKKGQKVASGQGVAAIGQSGLATGPHLHYSVIHNGKFIDPIKYLR